MYVKMLIEDIEDTPEVTWDALADRFGGRTRKVMRDALKAQKRNDLVTRVDRNSGVCKNEPYIDTLVTVIENNPGANWEFLTRLFDRTEHTLRACLDYYGFGYLANVVTERRG